MCNQCIGWGGKRWHQYGSGYYERTDKSVRPKRTLRLHRVVWEHHHGAVPDDWHIHHRNENKADNRLDNLECLPSGAHASAHGTLRNSDRSQWRKAEPFDAVCGDCGQSVVRRVRKASYVCVRCRQLRGDAKRVAGKCCQHCGSAFRSRAGHFCSQRCVNLATNGATVRVLPEGRRRA